MAIPNFKWHHKVMYLKLILAYMYSNSEHLSYGLWLATAKCILELDDFVCGSSQIWQKGIIQ